MSGVAILNYMLSHDGGLLTVIPEGNIISGTVPLGTILPAISLRQISGIEYKTIHRDGNQLVSDRVQVSVLASTYAQQKQLIELIRSSIVPTRGNVNTFSVDSITQDIDGPDLYSENPVTYEQSIDYMVRFIR